VLALCLGLCSSVLVGCGEDRTPGQKSGYEGEELFRGILLASGPVAESIPEIRDSRMPRNFIADTKRLAAIEAAHELLIARIKQRDPGFFEKYQSMVQSGNELTVERSFAVGAQAVVDAVLSMDDTGAARKELESGEALEATLRADASKRGVKIDAEALAQGKAMLKSMAAGNSGLTGQVGASPKVVSLVFGVVFAVYIVAAVDLAVAVNVVAGQALAVAIAVAVTQAVTVTNGTPTPPPPPTTPPPGAPGTSTGGGDPTDLVSATVAAHTVQEGTGRLQAEMMIHSVTTVFARPQAN
jgi:SdpC family antimicrobial peptide